MSVAMRVAPAAVLALVVCVGPADAQVPAAVEEGDRPVWDMAVLGVPPAVYPAEGFSEEGVEAVFFEGPRYRGQPTRVFAWVGVPDVPEGERVSGMVLVHGGGGTAFAEWVRLWTSRGYAAIAMDTCGCVPRGSYGNWERHERGGPPGWGGWDQIGEPWEDQWTYHAVASAILAHSLLASRPGVDPDRIGLTGISWGGYLASILAGVDPRLKLVVPVYGCGYYLDTGFGDRVRALGEEGADRWMKWWDPSVYLPDAHMPMLWVTGTNDRAYPLPALQKSYRTPPGERALCVTLRMPHGHGGPGENPKEIHVFADAILRGGPPLARFTRWEIEDGVALAEFESPVPVTGAELLYTTGLGDWTPREWLSVEATLGPGNTISAALPEGASVAYINLVDERGVTVSTEHVELR